MLSIETMRFIAQCYCGFLIGGAGTAIVTTVIKEKIEEIKEDRKEYGADTEANNSFHMLYDIPNNNKYIYCADHLEEHQRHNKTNKVKSSYFIDITPYEPKKDGD